jgi:SAM-dependent methyltransferase
MDDQLGYQPHLPVVDHYAVDQIRRNSELDWFHRIDVDGYVTPGFPYEANWTFVSKFLRHHQGQIRDAEILEPGCADGLWTCWFTKLGAKHIDSTDAVNREQFRLVARAFALLAGYYPGILSTALPHVIKRSYDLVASLGVLYHVHDPLTTLIMYVRYLRDGGVLLLETAAIQSDEPYLHYTARGEIYGRDGGNQFIPTIGFLIGALGELGMTVQDEEFRSEGLRDQLGKPVGRLVMAASKTGGVEVHHYAQLLDQLGMLGPEFTKQRWVGHVV